MTPRLRTSVCLVLSAASLSGAAGAWAQAGATPAFSGEILFWCSVLLAAAVLLGVIFLLIRKRLMREDGDHEPLGMGFTLADLRQMHTDGQLSDEEFDYAKRKMTARLRADFEEQDDVPAAELHLDDGDEPPPPADKSVSPPDPHR